MTKPEAIIFDYGRVLVGPLDQEAFAANLDALARERGFEQGIELWHHIFISRAWEQAKRGRISHEAFWAERLAALGIKDEAGRFDFKSRLYRYWGLWPAMRDLLYDLRPRYRLAILSNTSRRHFEQYIEQRRGLPDLFEVIVSSAEVGFAKPELQAYQVVLKRLGIRPEQGLFVDDLPRNTLAAETVGIPSIVFTTPEALQAELKVRDIL